MLRPNAVVSSQNIQTCHCVCVCVMNPSFRPMPHHVLCYPVRSRPKVSLPPPVEASRKLLRLHLWAVVVGGHLLRAPRRDGRIFPLEAPHPSQLRRLLVTLQFRVRWARRCPAANVAGVRPPQSGPGSLSSPEDEGSGRGGDRYGPHGGTDSDARLCPCREATGRRCRRRGDCCCDDARCGRRRDGCLCGCGKA